MDNYKQIQALQNKILDINAQAASQGRGLNASEKQLISDIRDCISDLEASTPAPGSRATLENWNSGAPYAAAPQNNGGGFRNLGDQLLAVHEAGRPGGKVDHRLFNATGLGESVPSDGGFLLNSDFSTALLGGIFEKGTVPDLCSSVEIGSNANSIKLPLVDETSRATGSRWGGIRGYWKDEAELKIASKPTFRQIELNLHKVTALIYATDELLQDSSVLQKIVSEAASDELAFLLNDAIINGTGAGQPLGILNSPSLVTITKEAGQNADTIVFENIMKMWGALLPRARKSAVWLINQNIEPQLYQMSIAVGTGGIPVYMPAGGVSGLPYSTLFGRPVIPHESCATLGDIGDIILADFTNGYLLARKGGVQSAMSIHVLFAYDESVFRFVMRVDGQPILANSILPFKGAQRLGHFVVIEAR